MSSGPSPASPRGGWWWPPLLVGAAILYMMDLSWLRWADLLIDTGRELSIPESLAGGKVLYRDVFYIYGPLSPYLNALLYKLFGVHVLTAAASGFLTLLLVCLLLYRLAASFLSRWAAAGTVVVFILVLAFSNYTVNPLHTYILPYSFPSIHGLAGCLGAMWSFHRHLATGRRKDLALSGVFLLLALLTKAEMGGAVLAAISCGIWMAERQRGRSPGAALTGALRAAGWPLLGAVAVYGGFEVFSGGRLFESLLTSGPGAALKPWEGFAARIGGWMELGNNLLGMGVRTAQWLALGGLFAGGGILLERCARIGEPARRRGAEVAVALGMLGLGLLLCLWPPMRPFWFPDPSFLAPLPLLSLAVLVRPLGRWLGGGVPEADRIFLASLGILSFLLLPRIILRVGAGFFGSYLAVPGFLLLMIVLFRLVPDRLGQRRAATAFRLSSAVLLALVVAGHQDFLRHNFSGPVVAISTSRGEILIPEVEGYVDPAPLASLVRHLSEPEREGRTLVVFPEGQMVNFLSGLENPLYHNVYLPVDLASPAMLERLLEELERKRPDYLVETARPLDAYDARRFGDYAAPVVAWARENYELERDFEGAAVLYRRKGLPPP